MSKSLLCVLSPVEATMNECLKGPLVRLTHGLVAPGVNDLCYADDGSRLQQRDDIFIMDGEAQRHVWLTLAPCLNSLRANCPIFLG